MKMCMSCVHAVDKHGIYFHYMEDTACPKGRNVLEQMKTSRRGRQAFKMPVKLGWHTIGSVLSIDGCLSHSPQWVTLLAAYVEKTAL